MDTRGHAARPAPSRAATRAHALTTTLRATATLSPGAASWTFATGPGAVRVTGRIEAPADAFVLLEYPNPPGGTKYCLNTKLAACEVVVADHATGEREVLRSAHGGLYEVLDDVDPRER